MILIISIKSSQSPQNAGIFHSQYPCLRTCEQATTVREKQELQKKQKTLDIIRQNFTALLYAPEISSDLLPAKQEPISVTRDK